MPRRSTQVLTAKFVENAQPPREKVFDEYPDAALPGMCLRVYKTGARSYILSTRVNGKLKRGKIGDAALMPLAEARQLAGDAKDRAKAGHQLPRYDARSLPADGTLTFGQVAEDYIRRECPKLARGVDTEATIRRELLPAWRRIPIAELRKSDARDLTDKMIEDRPAAAYKLHKTYTRLLSWALEHYDAAEIGVQVSPLSGLRPPAKTATRDRVLTEAEIGTLWRVWNRRGYPYGPMQQLLLLTAQRRSEVAGATWNEIDLDKRVWSIPTERTKSSRAHVVPLSDQAAALLADLPRFAGGDFVFTANTGRSAVNGFSAAKARTDRLAEEMAAAGEIELVAPWRVHDLRRTARTGMAELGVPEIIAERVLNHGPKGLVAVYDRYQYLPEKAAALQRWANRVTDIVSPTPANVVPIVEGAARG